MQLTTTKDGQVAVRNLAKTFAAGKTAEKHLYQTLSDLGLPSGRVSASKYFHCDLISSRI